MGFAASVPPPKNLSTVMGKGEVNKKTTKRWFCMGEIIQDRITWINHDEEGFSKIGLSQPFATFISDLDSTFLEFATRSKENTSIYLYHFPCFPTWKFPIAHHPVQIDPIHHTFMWTYPKNPQLLRNDPSHLLHMHVDGLAACIWSAVLASSFPIGGKLRIWWSCKQIWNAIDGVWRYWG